MQIKLTQISNGWIVGIMSVVGEQMHERAIFCKDINEVIELLKTMDK